MVRQANKQMVHLQKVVTVVYGHLQYHVRPTKELYYALFRLLSFMAQRL